MAITVQDQPDWNNYEFHSVGNPIEFLVSSTNTAVANFKLDVNIYHEPSGVNTLISNLKYDIIPDTTQVLIDVAPILKSKISESITNLRTVVQGLQNETSKMYRFNVKFQEYLGTIPSLSGSVTTSNTYYYFNGALKYKEWQRNDIDLFRLNSNTGSDTLTGRLLSGFSNKVAATHSAVVASPATYFRAYNVMKIRSNQLLQTQFIWAGTSGGGKRYTIYYYDSNFNAVFSGTKTATSTTNYVSMNVGTTAIIGISGGTLGSLDSTAKYMSISVSTDTYQLTGTYLYELDWSPCGRFDTYEMHWLNRNGGWDSWVFDKRSYVSTMIDRKSYNQYTIPISGSSIVHNTYDINGHSHIVSTKEKYEVRSGY
jgi:hypothetical protein